MMHWQQYNNLDNNFVLCSLASGIDIIQLFKCTSQINILHDEARLSYSFWACIVISPSGVKRALALLNHCWALMASPVVEVIL